MIDTFSVNSLKILDNSLDEFKRKYILSSELIRKNQTTELGSKFHFLICYYLKNFDIKKFENSLSENESLIWNNFKNSEIMNFVLNSDYKYIEQPFLCKLNSKNFLTGRFDLVIQNKDKYTILDWKIKKLPDDPKFDIQSIVYLYSASVLFKTENIDMIYYSLSEQNMVKTAYEKGYEQKINNIISKYLKNPN